MDLVIDEEPEHHQHHHRPHHQARGIFMGLVLFNGAVMRNQNTINIFWDESKLQRYIDKWGFLLCFTVGYGSPPHEYFCSITLGVTVYHCASHSGNTMHDCYPIALKKLLYYSALTPMVEGLREHPALAFWEVKIIQQIWNTLPDVQDFFTG